MVSNLYYYEIIKMSIIFVNFLFLFLLFSVVILSYFNTFQRDRRSNPSPGYRAAPMDPFHSIPYLAVAGPIWYNICV